MRSVFDRARPPWQRRAAVFVVMVFCGGVWGLVPALAKIALRDGGHPFGLTWWQGIGGGTLLLAVLLLRGRRIPLDRAHGVVYVFCGLFGTVLPTLALFFAAAHVSAGVLAMVLAMVPVFSYLLALAVRIDRAEPVRALGVALGLAGVALLVLPGGGSLAAEPWWVLVAALTPLGYAVENVFLAVRSPQGAQASILVCGMALTGGLMMTPVVLATGTWYPISWPLGEAEIAVLAIFCINLMSYVAFLALIFAAGPVLASMSGYFTVLTGVLWGMAIHDESHGLWFWAALATMIAGAALVRERRVERAVGAA